MCLVWTLNELSIAHNPFPELSHKSFSFHGISYILYDVKSVAHQNCRMLGVFDRKLEEIKSSILL